MKNLFNVKDKVVLITGASSGLGVQFAQLFGEQGAKLALVARRVDKLQQVQEELHAAHYPVFATVCDITQEEQVQRAVTEIVDHYGRIDILINNAGTAIGGKSEDTAFHDFQQVVHTNLNGVFLVAKEVGKVMIKQHYGKIINLGSIHSSVAMPADVSQVSAYAASKGGVLMLTKSLAAEWAKHNITVNAIGPAYFASEMTARAIESEQFLQFIQSRVPMKRIGNPHELDGAVLYFASDASSYTTGQILTIDGGWTSI